MFHCDLQVLFSALQPDSAHDHVDLITEVADSFMSLEHFNHALKYYQMLETNAGDIDVRKLLLFSLFRDTD